MDERTESREQGADVAAASSEEICRHAEDTLRGLLARMGLDVMVEPAEVADSADSREEMRLDIGGPDVAMVIGGRGKTLDALQFVVSRAASRLAGRPVYVTLDAQGYRARRAASLRDLALKLRAQVLRSGRPAYLEELTAAERRVVHKVVAEAGQVSSRSEGEDPYRVLVIEPISDEKSTVSG